MREIKFRAWDKNKNKMCEVTSINWYDEYLWVDETPMTGDRLMIEDAPLMQYTGLKDKNGTPIYEGDIVERKETGRKAIIKFIDGQFVYEDFVDDLDLRTPGTNDIRTIKTWGYEIIGNIYENPELIK